MIAVAAALMLAPVILERDRAAPENVQLPPSGAESASYFAWRDCVEQSARALRYGPDSAITLANVALTACRDEERAAISDPANTLTAARWTAERKKLEEFALVMIARLRADDAISRRDKTN